MFFFNRPISYARRQHAEDAYILMFFRVVPGDVLSHVTSMGYRLKGWGKCAQPGQPGSVCVWGSTF